MRDDVIVHIVDDDEAVRRSLVFLCSSAGYAVRPHVSATAFLAVAPSLSKDCLLVDLRMPDMNGVELLRRLREIGASLPTVVVTGNGDIKMAVEAMKLGAIDFVEKPFVEAVLFNAIERAANALYLAGVDRQLIPAVLQRPALFNADGPAGRECDGHGVAGLRAIQIHHSGGAARSSLQ